MYPALKDYISTYREHEYQLWSCAVCATAYYDPRPTIETLALLYAQYGTHAPPISRPRYDRLSILRRLRRQLTNSYTEKRFGSHEGPMFPWGDLVLRCIPYFRHNIDFTFRFIPKPTRPAKLLDYGCGNGSFLLVAKQCGYTVYGVDFDPVAVETAKHVVDNVYCGDVSCLPEDLLFDAITVSHVIEHLYDPIGTLKQIYHHLKPGGFIYIETPNIDSIGHQYYKSAWRGLEPPRHLQIFSLASLSGLLNKAGFISLRTPASVNPVRFICESSNIVRRTERSLNDGPTSGSAILFERLLVSFLSTISSRNRNEFIVMTAHKPL